MAYSTSLGEINIPSYEDSERWEYIAALFKTLSDATRLKIVAELMEAERRVCDMARHLDLSLPAISYHLKLLKDACLVKCRRDGKNSYYSINGELLKYLFHAGASRSLPAAAS